MKQRLYMVQVNGRYGENVYLPLSVGCLWAYARTFPEIDDAYEMVDFLYLKESIDVAVARLDRPDLIALSCYIWNWEWSKAFAQAVKKRWPHCQIIVGGVQVQDESPQILDAHPYFDFAIYGEGEGAFADFLREHARQRPMDPLPPQYNRVGSLVWRARAGTEGNYHYVAIANLRRAFTPLEELRSPYLDGVFDALLPREKRWQVLQETCRGCPYDCSFCSWGQAALAKLRPLPEDRVLGELEWFGQHHVDYLDNADANYGILKRDLDLTRALVEVKARHGYPKTFRTSFAKNSNDVIWEIANLLSGAEMLKAVTLAMQSMDDGVLVNIQRKNIKFSKFGELLERYEAAGIPTYTELILGLPGETLEMFLSGIDKNLDAGQHSGLFIYLNILLNNTEQNTPTYLQAHGLVSKPMQAMLTHGTPDDSVPREVQEIIVATAAMPHEDWQRAYLHAKVVEIFHSQGLLQEVARALRRRDVPYRAFYGALLSWCLLHPETVAGRAVGGVRALLERVLAGGSWDCVDARLGDISWPPEEFAFAQICLERDRFYDELADFLLSQGVEDDEITRQRNTIARPGDDTVAWARQVVWYGRKGNARKLRQTV